ncbi:Tigger transposable element-derived protein 6 [Dictyocoela muelleri]|nr:Tigger transposable element-derived protein 6 [Dictyocoela muelleri]
MFGTNPFGERLMSLIIGKSMNPRYFKNVDLSSFNVLYRANKTSWLTGSLFDEYLTILNLKLVKKNRSILILVDNFNGHKVENKSNIKLFFFPPNCTSVIQPLI